MSEDDFVYPTVGLAVDIVLLTVQAGELRVLVIERGYGPFLGRVALPGGFVMPGEDLVDAAYRELAEETSLGRKDAHLEQLGCYGTPDRDPRGRVVSVAYLALAPDLPMPTAGSDARLASWEEPAGIRGKLAFDHDQILTDAIERARRLLELTTLATAFCRRRFTIGDLRQVYEAVWGATLDPRNFARKVLGTKGFLIPTQEQRASGGGRPAALYRRGPAENLNPPLMRGQ